MGRLILRRSSPQVAQQSRFLFVVKFCVKALQRRLHCRERAAGRVYGLLHGL
jgi:hypothetical protein